MRISKEGGNELPENSANSEVLRVKRGFPGGPTFEGRCGIQNVKKRNRGRMRRDPEVAGYRQGPGAALRSQWTGWPQGQRCPAGQTREAG